MKRGGSERREEIQRKVHPTMNNVMMTIYDDTAASFFGSWSRVSE
jgi:hypothetical protein